MKPEISITIPAYNEEGSIEKTVGNLTKIFDEKKVNYEIVIVNNGSWDKTQEIIEKLSKENNRITIIHIEPNRGYGGGIIAGMDNSKGEIIGWTCADEEISAEDTYRIYSAFKGNNAEVVKALRTKRTDGRFRIFTSFVFNFMSNARFRIKLKDINGYPVFFKREVYDKVKPDERAHLFNLDLMKKMRENRLRIIEIPVIHRKRKAGKSFMKPSRIIEMTTDLLKYSVK
jgi:glycosyltransferase involved in cell wall biosynthesis